MALCRDIVVKYVEDFEDICKVLCYPRIELCGCIDRFRELKDLGISKLIDYGPLKIGNISVVGKGHSSIVVLARHVDYGIVAVKIRRVDSKRSSLRGEAEIIKNIANLEGIPKLYSYSDNFIVREYIDGLPLKEFVETNIDNQRALRMAMARIIMILYRLDTVGVDLDEIRNPLKQIVVECNNPQKAYIIDFESAKVKRSSSNVTKILSFIMYTKILDKPIYRILGISDEQRERLYMYALLYKRSLEKRSSIIEEIVNSVFLNN